MTSIKVYAIILTIVVAVSIAVGFFNTAQAQLTSGDIARLTDEQRYTLDTIKDAVFWLVRSNDTENTSTLTDDEISMQIFEYFINEGIILCNNVEMGFVCMDSSSPAYRIR